MATYYPDNFWVDSDGNVTLATNGVPDGAGSATFPSFKNDVEAFVGPESIVSSTQPALTYDATRTSLPMRTLAASATHKVLIPFPQELLRTYVPAGGVQATKTIAATSKGMVVKTLKLYYRVNTGDLTSITAEIDYKAFATEASLGAPTVPAVTVSGGTLTAAANIYTLLVTVTTPFLVVTTGSRVWAMATIVVAGGDTCDVFGANWGIAWGLL